MRGENWNVHSQIAQLLVCERHNLWNDICYTVQTVWHSERMSVQVCVVENIGIVLVTLPSSYFSGKKLSDCLGVRRNSNVLCCAQLDIFSRKICIWVKMIATFRDLPFLYCLERLSKCCIFNEVFQCSSRLLASMISVSREINV